MVSNNIAEASSSPSGSEGSATSAEGGGIYEGVSTFTDDTISGNQVIGGSYATFFGGSIAYGGGIAAGNSTLHECHHYWQ